MNNIAVHRKRRNEIETKVSRKKRKDIEDEELKSNLESVVYKYTRVFSKELSSQAALVEPYKIMIVGESGVTN